jgi:hypothetical protein
MRCAIRKQRESAVVSYLCARRFPLKSKEAVIMRLLARTARNRMKKLQTMLEHLRAADAPRPVRWLFVWRRLYISFAPRPWLLLWLKHHKD